MKTTLLTVFLSCAAAGVFAQGQVQFRNIYQSGPIQINAPVFVDGTPIDNSNTLWRAALLGGPTSATAANVPGSWSGAGATAVLGTLSTLYNPVNTTLTWCNFRAAPNAGSVTVANASRVIPDVNWGGSALVQMVAWHGNYATWAEAFNAWQSVGGGVWIGTSNPLTLTLPTGPTDPNLTYLVGLQSFYIYTPEPGSFALAGLGAAALLIFRRRNERFGP